MAVTSSYVSYLKDNVTLIELQRSLRFEVKFVIIKNFVLLQVLHDGISKQKQNKSAKIQIFWREMVLDNLKIPKMLRKLPNLLWKMITPNSKS